jgi:hypothetical protein
MRQELVAGRLCLGVGQGAHGLVELLGRFVPGEPPPVLRQDQQAHQRQGFLLPPRRPHRPAIGERPERRGGGQRGQELLPDRRKGGRVPGRVGA